MKPEINEQLKSKIPDMIRLLQSVTTIKGRDLSNSLGINERSLRLMVNYARQNVTPRICSGDFGYQWETENKKVIETIKRTKAHAYSEIDVCLKQEKLLREEIV